jgi:acyl carrier protein
VARFVPQSVSPSTNPRTRARTEYLAPLRADIERAIRAYYSARPEGEDVTLAVLREIGEDRLRAIGGRRDFDTIKKDAGLYVPIVLVDMYTAPNVHTYRNDDGRSVSTRSARGEPSWVNKYSPHRVLHGAPDRIVLDTNAIRNILASDPNAIDLEELARLKGRHPVSIADPAWAELVKALLEGRIGFDAWSKRIREVSAILDSDLPIAPSGRDAAAMSGVAPNPKTDFGHLSSYYRAVWKYVSEVNALSDFETPSVFETPKGERFRIGPLKLDKVSAAFDERTVIWSNFIARLRVNDASRALSMDEIADDIRASLAAGMDLDSLDRLDLVVRVIARLAVNQNKRRAAGTPNTNDAIDLDVLFSTMLPAVVCTSDKKMLAAASASGSGSAWRVKNPTDLLAWLSRP